MFPISVVSQKTGLTPDVLRAWERRYHGVRTQRDDGGRRVYSRELLDRLIVIARLLRAGYRIGDVVELDSQELVERLEELAPSQAQGSGYASFTAGTASSTRSGTEKEPMEAAVQAVLKLDAGALREAAQMALTSHGRLELADGFVFPVIRQVRALQLSRQARSVHLSFAHSNLRIIAGMFLVLSSEGTGNTILVATPVGYGSDLGCVASAVHIHAAGHTPVLLGAEVPVEDIVSIVQDGGGAGVLITFVCEKYDSALYAECLRLREALPLEIPVYFGGRIPETLVRDLVDQGLIQLQDMAHLRSALS
ncbi:MAG: MerR family transcriptional regulator [Spirochaeta sp.]|nr:MerR family transcriptional regulator [Spirochaeta sp.]